MTGALVQEAQVAQYELEIEIAASADAVWQALVDETDAWWLPDFQMVDASSKVTFDIRAGGGLIEQKTDGGSLLWYTVQFCKPDERTVYLVGHLAPDWGGPTTSHLKLQVESMGENVSLFKVSDAHFGRIDEASLNSMESGWAQLFRDGLKSFVEAK